MIGKKLFALLIALAMLLSTFGLAAAEEAIPACKGDEVVGIIVSVDAESGLIVIQTEAGECSVSLDQEYDHPIVDLFNDYFGIGDLANLEEAVAGLHGWAAYDETTLSWQWLTEETEGASSATIIGIVDNGDGTFTVELAVEGEVDPVFLTKGDPDEIAFFNALFDAASVEFALKHDTEGNSILSDVGDDVKAFHDNGMGFGVLTKFYSLAAETDFTVDELVTLFKESKMGLGKIFKEYGTPDMKGVGHIKQELKEDDVSSLQSEEHEKQTKPEKPNKPEKQNNGGKPAEKSNNGKKKD